jgi:hypothetical protein
MLTHKIVRFYKSTRDFDNIALNYKWYKEEGNCHNLILTFFFKIFFTNPKNKKIKKIQKIYI